MLHWLEGGALPPTKESPPESPPAPQELQVPTYPASALTVYPQGFPLPLQWPSDQMQNMWFVPVCGADAPVLPPDGGIHIAVNEHSEYEDFSATSHDVYQGTGVAVIDPAFDFDIDVLAMQLDQFPEGYDEAYIKPTDVPSHDYKSIKRNNPSVFMPKKFKPPSVSNQSMAVSAIVDSPIDVDSGKRKSPDNVEQSPKIYNASIADPKPEWKRQKWSTSSKTASIPSSTSTFQTRIKLGAPELKTVGGVPMYKSKQTHSESDKINKEMLQEKRKVDRMESRSNGSSPRPALKVNNEWIALRQFQAQRIFLLFCNNSDECQHGIITDQMRTLAENLVAKAANASFGQSRKLTSSPSFWACTLALEAYARLNPGGYVAGDESAVNMFRFSELEFVVKENKNTETFCDEEHPNPDKEMLRQLRGNYSVKRTICSHSFGGAKEMTEKMNFLNSLLISAGDRGLHPDIIHRKPPTFHKYTKVSTVSSTVREKLVSGWGKKKGQKN